MTKEEFKLHIGRIADTYGNYQVADRYERDKAEQFREYDPVLADLINKHMDAVANVYKYVFSKIERNETNQH